MEHSLLDQITISQMVQSYTGVHILETNVALAIIVILIAVLSEIGVSLGMGQRCQG